MAPLPDDFTPPLEPDEDDESFARKAIRIVVCVGLSLLIVGAGVLVAVL
jgi:hypothetical protein